MLNCAMCDKALQECCDIFEWAVERATGRSVVLCGECIETLKAGGELGEGETDDGV